MQGLGLCASRALALQIPITILRLPRLIVADPYGTRHNHYASALAAPTDGSAIFTPGPIVELIETFFT